MMKEIINGIFKIGILFWECFMDLIFPSNIYCMSCGNLIDDSRPYSLCDACVRTMKWATGRTCMRCGKPLREGYGPDCCTDCLSEERIFEAGVTCASYGRSERDILHRFKYKNQAYLGRKIAEIMYERIKLEDLQFDVAIPVPMFKGKERKRGYNQAAILARELAKNMEIAYDVKSLTRIVETEAMSNLGAEERKLNIKEAFFIEKKRRQFIENKRILLIDDIFTTGSTSNACAKKLYEAGALNVRVLTFAAGADILKNQEPDDEEKSNFQLA